MKWAIDHAFTYSFYPIRWNKYVEETITRAEKVAERNGADLTDPEVGLTVLVAIREGLTMGMTEQTRGTVAVLKDPDEIYDIMNEKDRRRVPFFNTIQVENIDREMREVPLPIPRRTFLARSRESMVSLVLTKAVLLLSSTMKWTTSSIS